LARWSERWFPDPLVFALLGVVCVFGGGVLTGERPYVLAIQAGKGFWALASFTLQMVMIIIGGYVVASTPMIRRTIQAIAGIPKTPRGAIAMVAFFSTTSALLSWGLSLVFSGLLVRELARRVKGFDYCAAGAAGYLGLSIFAAMGLSSSAALLMATRTAIPASIYKISGVIPLRQTLFLWQSLAIIAVVMTISVSVAWLTAPSAANARTAEDLGVDLSAANADLDARTKPGEWLEYSPILTVLVAAILCVYLVDLFRNAPQGALAALDLNTYNMIFITLGLLFQWRPKRFLRAVGECVPATAGVLIQFPIYAMIFGMITGTGLSARIAHVFEAISTHDTYPLCVAAYSATLGIFIPSAGSKWIVEAPYVMQAAITNRVHLAWVVQIYNAAESLPNLINPFWMLPLLGILKIRARDIVSYAMLQLSVQAPVVFFLCWLFARHIEFLPPIK
jgi:short-chain fatty acids transporter